MGLESPSLYQATEGVGSPRAWHRNIATDATVAVTSVGRTVSSGGGSLVAAGTRSRARDTMDPDADTAAQVYQPARSLVTWVGRNGALSMRAVGSYQSDSYSTGKNILG